MKIAALAIVLSLVVLASGLAHADVIEVPVPCAPWQDRAPGTHHGGAGACIDRACRSDAQCAVGHCYNPRRVCVVDGREIGACASEGHCARGECVSIGTCGP